MAAYVVVEVETTDEVEMARYREMARPIIESMGGRYLARGGRSRLLEGSGLPTRLVILEFDSFEQAEAWWASDEYAEAKGLRQQCGSTRMLLVAGV
ncbi:MAG: DUF1330 domain-containing protein [Dehalococcoidia bacterium]